jgi:hypothetical protein
MPGRTWLITEAALRQMLGRVAGGEDPEIVLLEVYANAEKVERRKPDDD